MSAFFDVAGEMWLRGMCTPDAWKYSPGAGGAEVSEDSRIVFDSCDVTDDQLRLLGDCLHVLVNALDAAGRSY